MEKTVVYVRVGKPYAELLDALNTASKRSKTKLVEEGIVAVAEKHPRFKKQAARLREAQAVLHGA